jgi:hypothetical protein
MSPPRTRWVSRCSFSAAGVRIHDEWINRKLSCLTASIVVETSPLTMSARVKHFSSTIACTQRRAPFRSRGWCCLSNRRLARNPLQVGLSPTHASLRTIAESYMRRSHRATTCGSNLPQLPQPLQPLGESPLLRRWAAHNIPRRTLWRRDECTP